MKLAISRLCILLTLVFTVSCSNIIPSKLDQTHSISISGKLTLPLLLNDTEYVLDQGPLFIMSRDPLAVYRVINQEEIEFVGSNKSVFEFIQDSLTKPQEMSEISFSESLSTYNNSHLKKDHIHFYIFESREDSKIYITSQQLGFAVEATLSMPFDSDILDKITNQTKLVKGE